MVDREKVRLMSELAAYEKREGRENYIINSYFKIDYVTKHMLASFFGYTICFVLVFALALLFSAQEIMDMVDFAELYELFRKYVIWYFAGLAAYELISIVVYCVRYGRARKNAGFHTVQLKKLKRKYYGDTAAD